jgi:hypothetical protein
MDQVSRGPQAGHTVASAGFPSGCHGSRAQLEMEPGAFILVTADWPGVLTFHRWNARTFNFSKTNITQAILPF